MKFPFLSKENLMTLAALLAQGKFNLPSGLVCNRWNHLVATLNHICELNALAKLDDGK